MKENEKTTMGYLRFPLERRLDDFPSMQEYIQKPHKMEKNTIRANKIRANLYNNFPKLPISRSNK